MHLFSFFRPTHHHHKSVLFVLRKPHRDSALYSPYQHPSSGLVNSATFVKNMLLAHGVIAHLVEVVDSNSIDRVVCIHNPDVVILEAIWCPPAKLVELTALARHRHRHWVVRNHSELPFLSLEGNALDWFLSYPSISSVSIACNSPVASHEISRLIEKPVLYLPNYYPVTECGAPHHRDPEHLNVGCFGAIRPLKNHLEQAAAAILFARARDLDLRFHINASRIEGKAEPVLKSLRALFDHTPNTRLVEHGWLSHHAFVRLCGAMHLGLQVSFSETFNIVSADLVNQGVPVVCSLEVPWCPASYCASPTSAIDIASKMSYALRHGAEPQRDSLRCYAEESEKIWLKFLRRD